MCRVNSGVDLAASRGTVATALGRRARASNVVDLDMLASIHQASGRGCAPHTRPGSLAIAGGSPTANTEPRVVQL
jgi:hypothetical protein